MRCNCVLLRWICLFVGVCHVVFVVMVPFHEASVYIPPLKIEPSFGNATVLTCDMLVFNLRI